MDGRHAGVFGSFPIMHPCNFFVQRGLDGSLRQEEIEVDGGKGFSVGFFLSA